MDKSDKTTIIITFLVCLTIVSIIAAFPLYYTNKTNIIAKSPDPVKTACALEVDSSSTANSKVLLMCERPK